MLDHGDEEHSASQRMAYVRQFRLSRLPEYIIDEGRNVIISNFVPTDENKLQLKWWRHKNLSFRT